jgi:DNA repair protein RecO (recombination protein O)
LLLGQLGFGLDLEQCTVTGTTADLAFVSPRSGAAVSAGAAFGYEAKLLPLPAFLSEGGVPDWPEIFAAGRITAHFLARDLLIGLRHDPMPARARLFDRFKRAVA